MLKIEPLVCMRMGFIRTNNVMSVCTNGDLESTLMFNTAKNKEGVKWTLRQKLKKAWRE